MKEYIEDLVIEVTRKCNLKCEHCLRGESQNRNIDVEKFKNDFDINFSKYNLEYLNNITFTGGEPF